MTQFLAEHAEVMDVSESANEWGIVGTNEWAPSQSISTYFGSSLCGVGMCGPTGISYINRASTDVHRWDCAAYVARAREVAAHEAAKNASGYFVFKHPALTLGGALLQRSCAALHVPTHFVEVSRDPREWNSNAFGCSGACRTISSDMYQRCGVAAARCWPLGTQRIHFEEFDQLSTWRGLEQWLGLRPIPVSIIPGKPGKSRRLMLHGQSKTRKFTVWTGYLHPVCTHARSQWEPLESFTRACLSHA